MSLASATVSFEVLTRALGAQAPKYDVLTQPYISCVVVLWTLRVSAWPMIPLGVCVVTTGGGYFMLQTCSNQFSS